MSPWAKGPGKACMEEVTGVGVGVEWEAGVGQVKKMGRVLLAKGCAGGTPRPACPAGYRADQGRAARETGKGLLMVNAQLRSVGCRGPWRLRAMIQKEWGAMGRQALPRGE